MSEVTLSVIGLSSQEETVVNVAANLLAAFDYSVKVLDAGDASGDIVLIGPASDGGRAVLGRLAAGQRAVLFVDRESDGKGYPALIRPVRVQALRDLLAELLPRLGARTPPRPGTVAAAAPVQAEPVRAVPAATGSPLAGNLFYLMLDAVLNRTLMRIDCGDGNPVLVHGPTQCIYTRADGSSLQKLAQEKPQSLNVKVLKESEFMHSTKGMSLTRLHDVIWLAERHGSRGELLAGHSLDVPVHLKVWPKFNSRHVRPEYLKLAAFLSRQTLTLRALAEVSNVALPHVIDFYNTSVAFGVIEKNESAPVVTPPPKKMSTSGGLLGKIASRLALKRD